ncbi:Ig domain-containing protein, partial [Rhizobiaceae sp. 2RAB30]
MPAVSGAPFGPIALSVGSNKIGIHVVASDRSTSRNYIVTAIRAEPSSIVLDPAGGALAGGTVGVAYSRTVSASGGLAPYAYAVASGALPAGLSLNPSTGAITGRPTAVGGATFTVTATDAGGATGEAEYTLAVVAAPSASFTFSPPGGPLPAAMAGEEYRQAITVKGGKAPLILSLVSGELPDGLKLSPAGELSGQLADKTEGNYAFTVTVKDADA